MKNTDPNRTAKQIREGRLVIVAELLRKGKSVRAIAAEIQKREFSLKPPSNHTVLKYQRQLLQEWRDARLKDTDLAVQQQLEEIDFAVEELWDQWDKSKADQKLRTTKKKGELTGRGGDSEIKTKEVENTTKEEVNCGDVRYIAEIRAQQAEKRKLLGLYPADKKDITTNGESLNNGFYEFLKMVNTVEE